MTAFNYIPGSLLKIATALKVADLAKLLSVSQRQVYKLVQEGKIPHFKVGKSLRFDPDTIAAWLEKNMAENSPDGTAKKKP